MLDFTKNNKLVGVGFMMFQVLIKSVKSIKNICFSIIFLLFSSNVYAVEPDITGVYSGNISGNDGATPCPNPGQAFSASVSINISNFNGSTFDVNFSGTDTDGEVFEATGSGSFSSPSLSFTANFSDGGSIIVGGSLSGDVISFGFSGADDIGCSFNGNPSSVTRVSGELVVNPAVTSSSTVTEAVLFNTQVQSTIFAVSSHIFGAMSGLFFGGPLIVSDDKFIIKGATGLNAGDGTAIPYGVWGSYSYTDYENDLSSIAFDGSNHGFLGGIDFSFWGNTIVGIAMGYDYGDIDTTFNSGNQQTDSFTIAPYFGALLTDSLSVDFTLGYSKVEFDQFRTLGATRITSSPNADRWFGALNLNAITFYDKWIIGGRVGASFASSQIDSYTESNSTVVADSRTKLSTISIAGDVAYSYADYEPFLNLSYQNDFQLREITVTAGPQSSNDSDDILMTTGVRYFNKNGVTGNLEYSKRFLRDDFDEDRISLTVRADF
jgi:autotransporter-like protein